MMTSRILWNVAYLMQSLPGSANTWISSSHSPASKLLTEVKTAQLGPYHLAPTYQSSLSLMLDTLNWKDSSFFTASNPTPRSSTWSTQSQLILRSSNQICPLICEVLPVPIPPPSWMNLSLRKLLQTLYYIISAITALSHHFLIDTSTHLSSIQNVNPWVTSQWSFHISSVGHKVCKCSWD